MWVYTCPGTDCPPILCSHIFFLCYHFLCSHIFFLCYHWVYTCTGTDRQRERERERERVVVCNDCIYVYSLTERERETVYVCVIPLLLTQYHTHYMDHNITHTIKSPCYPHSICPHFVFSFFFLCYHFLSHRSIFIYLSKVTDDQATARTLTKLKRTPTKLNTLLTNEHTLNTPVHAKHTHKAYLSFFSVSFLFF